MVLGYQDPSLTEVLRDAATLTCAPIELRQALGLRPDQVRELVGNAYGRADAPLLFYKELRHQLLLVSRHMRWNPVSIIWKRLSTASASCPGTHVDDGIGGGDSYIRSKLEVLRKALPFGSFKVKELVFTDPS